MAVRTRFAPSPTGYMHVGSVRTALFAWLVARQTNGKFILRIEDTDKQREIAGSEDHIKECLKWLGLLWDEGPDKAGEYGPYRQSERLDIYKQWGQKLIDSGRAYADPYTQQKLNELREKAQAEKRPFLFRDHRPEDPPKWDGSQPLRFKSDPKDGKWEDAVMGEIKYGPEAIDDYILIKTDGYPTYNFAHIVDDHLMGVTHVMRSQEFLPSIPRFLNLYEALGIELPIIATLPFVLGKEGNKKLSKRDGAKDILGYRKDGYLPEALLNFMVTLGWNDGTEQEIFTVDELIAKFSLGRVQSSGARFDEQRLLWMNGHYLRTLPIDDLYKKIEDDPGYWSVSQGQTEARKKQVLSIVKERLKYLGELDELTSFFFKQPLESNVLELLQNPVDKQLKKITKQDMQDILKAVLDQLKDNSFQKDDLQTSLNNLLTELNSKPAILFPLIRIAVTGSKSSPEIFDTLEVIGNEESLRRIARAIEMLDA